MFEVNFFFLSFFFICCSVISVASDNFSDNTMNFLYFNHCISIACLWRNHFSVPFHFLFEERREKQQLFVVSSMCVTTLTRLIVTSTDYDTYFCPEVISKLHEKLWRKEKKGRVIRSERKRNKKKPTTPFFFILLFLKRNS